MHFSSELVFWGGGGEREAGGHWHPLNSPSLLLQCSYLPPDPPPTPEVNSNETILQTTMWRNIQLLILCRHNETDMLEEFKKMILRGSLSSRIIINNLNSNFSSISYKKCRRLTRGIWLFVGGWKLKQFFTRMRGCFCNMYCHVTISAWRRQFVLLSLITNSQITKKSDCCIFLFFPFLSV